ncbi:hypothetical protein SBA2_70021 [Acidobacteriia bacterium SbA2]|nr:hypothetical protein SBA2_70021 [Acidobacteriia bacterium SbA2]
MGQFGNRPSRGRAFWILDFRFWILDCELAFGIGPAHPSPAFANRWLAPGEPLQPPAAHLPQNDFKVCKLNNPQAARTDWSVSSVNPKSKI